LRGRWGRVPASWPKGFEGKGVASDKEESLDKNSRGPEERINHKGELCHLEAPKRGDLLLAEVKRGKERGG